MQLFLLKCTEPHYITYPYTINQEFVKYSMKSATCTFCEYNAHLGHQLARSERVALFISSERETSQGRKGTLLECTHEVCFPKACAGSEKIAKDI